MMKIDLSPMPEIAKHIYELANKIESGYGLNDISLKGIGIDGYFVGLGLAHVFREKYGVSLEVDAVKIRSNNGITFDKPRMDSYRNEDKRVFMIDKRSKTGALGAFIHENYPEFVYAVLVDVENPEKDKLYRADTFVTERDFDENFRWIWWGDGENELHENAFDTLGLKIEKSGEEYEYIIEGPRENYLLDGLCKEIDKLVIQNG